MLENSFWILRQPRVKLTDFEQPAPAVLFLKPCDGNWKIFSNQIIIIKHHHDIHFKFCKEITELFNLTLNKGNN